ncbi:hypothetical protein [Pseudoalteromonas obscura]|uniref:Uncharacterized protein n=1 Tax=Pseudoalteromonas obscura TaxID=3048491 RepID=A0ABT7EGR9_9GAMM|nr:hypothetical protein [Pseudoalteromonas sp. P94(2023)]MDK2594218.1 hypothetical protein [Pseudoalteromonas sp. P94(2023)]
MHFLNPMLQNHPMESSFIQTWLNRLADKYTPSLFQSYASTSGHVETGPYIDIYDARHGSVIYREFSDVLNTVEAISIHNGQLLNFGSFADVYGSAKSHSAMVRLHRLSPGEAISPSCVNVHCYLVESALCRHYADLGLFGLCGSAKRVLQDYNLDYIHNALDYLNCSLDKHDCLFCFGLDPYLLNWGKPLGELNVAALDALDLGRPVCIVSNNFSVAFVNSDLINQIRQSAIGHSPSFQSFIDSINKHGYVNAEGMSMLPWAFSEKELLWHLSDLPNTFGAIVELGRKQGVSHFEVALQSHFVDLLFKNLVSNEPPQRAFSAYYTYQSYIDELARLDHCEVMKTPQLVRLNKTTSVALTVGRLATCGYKWVHDYHYDELFVPCSSILRNGSNLCLHSDFPREPVCPLRLAEIATERDIEAMPNNYSCDERTLDPGQCITPTEALRAVTHGAAWHAKIAGFNTEGGAAHYMKLDGDPLCDKKRWRDIKVTLL